MYDRRRYARSLQHMSCEMRVGVQRYFGVVLDQSPEGMFLETQKRLPIGTVVGLTLRVPERDDTLALCARVARGTDGAPTGLGLELIDPPAAYRELVAALSAREFRVELKQTQGVETRLVLVRCGTEAEAAELVTAEIDESWKILSIH
jgi:Tfp pilus assembly protein PilZ